MNLYYKIQINKIKLQIKQLNKLLRIIKINKKYKKGQIKLMKAFLLKVFK